MFIIPAFFELLLHLQKHAVRFDLTFRTFGSDLPEVIREFNAFCSGHHPLYPHALFDGREGTQDLRVNLDHPDSHGFLWRGDNPPAIALALGTLERPSGADRPPYACSLQSYEVRISSFGRNGAHLLKTIYAPLEMPVCHAK